MGYMSKFLGHNKEEIFENLADIIVSRHSFEFKTFQDAQDSITIFPEIDYKYDRLSLDSYSTNLSREENDAVQKRIVSKFNESHNVEDRKAREEYWILLKLLRVAPEFAMFDIAKAIRPDFILTGEKRIGIEITEFVTKSDAVMYRIAHDNFGKGKSIDEITDAATAKHGSKASKYRIYDIDGNGTAAICNYYHGENAIDSFLCTIDTKYNKYKDMFAEFDEFILLCDAMSSVFFTHEYDVESLIKMYKDIEPESKGMNIYILWTDSLCAPRLSRFQL